MAAQVILRWFLTIILNSTILQRIIYDYRFLSIHDGHTLLGTGALAQRAALTWEPYNRLGCTEDRSVGRRSDWDKRAILVGILGGKGWTVYLSR